MHIYVYIYVCECIYVYICICIGYRPQEVSLKTVGTVYT